MVPLEAMAQGCPVIYSNRHSGPEPLRDSEEVARLGAAGREDVE